MSSSPTCKDVPYDRGRDFTLIIHIGAFPLGLAVSSSSRVRSIADLVVLSKTKKKGVDCASGGVGSVGHLTSARLVNALKIETTHIPYQVIGPAMLDLLANRIDFSFPVTTDAVERAKRGDIRLLAVTAEKRMASLPDVPTMIELGFPDFTPLVWYGYAASANTPADMVERLYAAFAAVARKPSVEERLRALGLVFNIMGPAEFRKSMGEDAIHWRKIIADNNITAGQ